MQAKEEKNLRQETQFIGSLEELEAMLNLAIETFKEAGKQELVETAQEELKHAFTLGEVYYQANPDIIDSLIQQSLAIRDALNNKNSTSSSSSHQQLNPPEEPWKAMIKSIKAFYFIKKLSMLPTPIQKALTVSFYQFQSLHQESIEEFNSLFLSTLQQTLRLFEDPNSQMERGCTAEQLAELCTEIKTYSFERSSKDNYDIFFSMTSQYVLDPGQIENNIALTIKSINNFLGYKTDTNPFDGLEVISKHIELIIALEGLAPKDKAIITELFKTIAVQPQSVSKNYAKAQELAKQLPDNATRIMYSLFANISTENKKPYRETHPGINFLNVLGRCLELGYQPELGDFRQCLDFLRARPTQEPSVQAKSAPLAASSSSSSNSKTSQVQVVELAPYHMEHFKHLSNLIASCLGDPLEAKAKLKPMLYVLEYFFKTGLITREKHQEVNLDLGSYPSINLGLSTLEIISMFSELPLFAQVSLRNGFLSLGQQTADERSGHIKETIKSIIDLCDDNHMKSLIQKLFSCDLAQFKQDSSNLVANDSFLNLMKSLLSNDIKLLSSFRELLLQFVTKPECKALISLQSKQTSSSSSSKVQAQASEEITTIEPERSALLAREAIHIAYHAFFIKLVEKASQPAQKMFNLLLKNARNKIRRANRLSEDQLITNTHLSNIVEAGNGELEVSFVKFKENFEEKFATNPKDMALLHEIAQVIAGLNDNMFHPVLINMLQDFIPPNSSAEEMADARLQASFILLSRQLSVFSNNTLHMLFVNLLQLLMQASPSLKQDLKKLLLNIANTKQTLRVDFEGIISSIKLNAKGLDKDVLNEIVENFLFDNGQTDSRIFDMLIWSLFMPKEIIAGALTIFDPQKPSASIQNSGVSFFAPRPPVEAKIDFEQECVYLSSTIMNLNKAINQRALAAAINQLPNEESNDSKETKGSKKLKDHVLKALQTLEESKSDFQEALRDIIDLVPEEYKKIAESIACKLYQIEESEISSFYKENLEPGFELDILLQIKSLIAKPQLLTTQAINAMEAIKEECETLLTDLTEVEDSTLSEDEKLKLAQRILAIKQNDELTTMMKTLEEKPSKSPGNLSLFAHRREQEGTHNPSNGLAFR